MSFINLLRYKIDSFEKMNEIKLGCSSEEFAAFKKKSNISIKNIVNLSKLTETKDFYPI